MRLFSAIPLPEPLLAMLAECQSAWARQVRLRWARPDGLHVTLQFYGDVEPVEAGALAAAIGREVASLNAFAAYTTHVGAFPRASAARVLWLGLEALRDAKAAADPRQSPLAALAARVFSAGAMQGFAADKAFVPHITLGRARGRPVALPLANLAPPPPTRVWIDRVVVFESHLGPGGARYSPVATLLLAGASASSIEAKASPEKK